MSRWLTTAVLLVVALGGSWPIFALTPEVSGVAISTVGRQLSIDYELSSAPAIVTWRLFTNEVAVVPADYANAEGGNRFVESAGRNSISWKLPSDWFGTTVKFTAEVRAWSPASPPDYAVFVLAADNPRSAARFYATVEDLPGGIGDERYRTQELMMRRIPAGARTMFSGLSSSLAGTASTWPIARLVLHPVAFTCDYYLGVFELTQGQVAGRWPNRPSRQVGGSGASDWATRPINNFYFDELRGSKLGAAWPDGEDPHAVDEGSLIAAMRKLTGLKSLDLPTSAEWEFASRAGVEANYADGRNDYTDIFGNAASSNAFLRLGWSCFNTPNATVQPVGLLEPNGFGLYDMQGNVYEQCLDWFTYSNDAEGKNSFSDGSLELDPKGPSWERVVDYRDAGGTRVTHGGGYNGGIGDLSLFAKSSAYTAFRQNAFYIGLRLAAAIDLTEL